jgi:hypothetical protein
MFIIVEGPDGAGKSTLVQEISMELWRRGRGTVLINPKRSPRQHPRVEYKLRLDFYRPKRGIDLILDRCWYSDDVYGPIWRDAGLEPGVCDELEDWAHGLGAVVARMDAPDHELIGRLTRRGDIDVKPAEAPMYAQLYRQQAQSWQLSTLVNPTAEEIIDEAALAEDGTRYIK